MIRVLHVVESFDGQAVEAWIARLLAFDGFDSGMFHFDFFLTGRERGSNSGFILEKGCEIHIGNPGGASILRMAKSLRDYVRKGSYDIVHIHQDVLAGVFALALAGTGVKVITHVHNCWQRLPVGGRLKERVLTSIARRLTLTLSSAIIGVSHQALVKMTGGTQRKRRIDRVIHCSVKTSEMMADESTRGKFAAESRAIYELPASAKLILFLGRLDDYKNPIFALEVLAQMVEKGDTDSHLIIAGVGSLDRQLDALVAKYGLEKRVCIVGWIDDPAPLLLASDLLLMPSQEWCGEGLGLVAVEAQGCGVPVLCSKSIPKDAQILSECFRRKSLNDGPQEWGATASELLSHRKRPLEIAITSLKHSAFTDNASYTSIADLYGNIAAGP